MFASLRPKTGVIRFAAALCLLFSGLLAANVTSSASGLNILTNGGFESGSFTPGWTAVNAGHGGWEVSASGTEDDGDTNPPAEGNFTALYTQNGPTSGILTSDPFTVPAGSTLSLDFAYDNKAGSWIPSDGTFSLTAYNQWLAVDVIKASASSDSLAPSDILLTLFDSQSGSPALSQGWTTLTASLASLAGQSVEIRVIAVDTDFYLPVWIDGVAVTGNLPNVTNLGVTSGPDSLTAAWAPNGNATSYTCTLMYGFNNPSDYSSQVTGSSCTFNGLAPGSTWGIQVVANAAGLSSGPVVAFGTVPVPTTTKPKLPRHRIICQQNNGKVRKSFAGVHPVCPSGYHLI